MMFMWLACGQNSLNIETESSELPAPEITSFEWNCDSESDLWTFDLKSDHWTSNGHIWINDGEFVEKHYIQSVGAEADGSADHLILELDIVSDWRDADPGKRTRFRCSHQESLSFLATVMHPETSSITDCIASNSFDWTRFEDAPQCDQALE